MVRVTRRATGLALGALTAVAHVLLLLPAAGALLVPAAPPAVAAAGRRLVGIERTRVTTLLGGADPTAAEPSAPRALRYLAARVPVGLLGGVVLALLVLGAGFAATILWSWVTGTPWLLDDEPATAVTGEIVAYYALSGAVLLYLGLAGATGVVRWERTLLARLLAPSREEQLARRVTELAGTRDAVVAAVDDERRRIERDLHDGVQQRLVALGMLLGRARRHPDRADELVAQAHEQAQRALVELREVSWRVYPAALDTEGLAAALESVAERAPLPVRITCAIHPEPAAAVRAAAWFVVSEAVTNAAKHSGASGVTIEVRTTDGALDVTVHDDGRGGADPAGGGLAGLARRVEAADGTLRVESPPGAGTVIAAHLPGAGLQQSHVAATTLHESGFAATGPAHPGRAG
ncbi:sensor histidine kinase [Pseudonocardia xinjiangensis]|uniref:sensor histidine kinase n=1 Tax=Pseudonocardia xinjiangensis TaxID=75289 RepID=UPI003D8EE8CE